MTKKGGEDGQNGNPMIIPADDLIRDDRWNTPKVFVEKLNADVGDLIGFEKINKKTYYVYTLDPKLFKEIGVDLTKRQDKEIYKELIASLPEGASIECDHIIQVRSKKRCGAKKHLEDILSDIGIYGGDFLYLKFVKNNDGEGEGWILSGMKSSDIKNILEIEVDDES